ncbi:MAG: peptidase C15 [Oculatellaceae cyanobacterium Prado106]|jgi:pyroglutamyl-peptidase|nr:peptidase C15 [Oculatellaceae cyanobacterium Prado106]
MAKTVLITSFTTWRNDQPSNASDDLLEALFQAELNLTKLDCLHFLRQLPVNAPIAQEMILAQVKRLQPEVLICCGMAESRSQLNLESSATLNGKTLQTSLNLKELRLGLASTEISHDAGQFVCNSLYYSMLEYFQQYHHSRHCLFLHVPILTPENQTAILADFCKILEKTLF